MGLVGWGRAFNLRFMPNGPLRTNCYHRPMPHVGLLGGGRHVSITENINIQQGPSGFWGFMTGLSQGLFGGGMFGMGSMFGMGMGGFSPFGALNAATTPQGATQASGEDVHLKNLTDFYGKSFIIKSHPDKKGIYQAVPKDGGKPIEGTYDELMDKLAEDKESPAVKPLEKKEPEKTEAQLKEEKAKEMGLTKSEDGKYMKDGKEYEWDGTTFKVKEDNSVVDDTDDAVVTGSKRKSRRTGTVDGNKDSKLSDAKNKAGTYKADVCHFEFQNLHGFGKTQGQLYVEFVDGNGERQHFSAKVPRIYLDEASCKAALTDNVRQQIQSAGWKKVTFG